MDTAPLVMQDIEAGEEFVKKLNNYRPVEAACWLRHAEEEERYLYVALDGLNESNIDLAYREVLRVAGELRDYYIDPFRVKLIKPEDPIARAIMDAYRRFPGRSAPHFNGRILEGVSVAEVYIYPPLLALS